MAAKRNLIIDGQLLQTEAWHRGMGKYMLAVMRELNLLSGDDWQISVLFNSSIKTESKRFQVVKYLCPGIQQFQVNLPNATHHHHQDNKYKKKLNNFINKNFSGDNYFLISSLFTFDYYAYFPEGCHKLLMMYDLTPFMFWRDLGPYFAPHIYMKRFEQIYEADLMFAISETIRQDVLNIFGFKQDRVVNINGGFTKVDLEATEPKHFKVPKRFMLFPTGDLPHKNNKTVVQGFAEFNRQNRDGYKLLMTSKFHPISKRKLSRYSKDIIFTGNISDEELDWLYQHADAVVFGSKYEGLGIPILDAVANDKPVIASRIPVFEEMAKNAYYFFDPLDKASLAEAMAEAVKRRNFSAKRLAYPYVMQNYTWEKTGRALMKALKEFHPAPPITEPAVKPRIAIACMNPGIKGQAGRLAESLHGALAAEYEIDYYFDSRGLPTRRMERPTFLDFIGTTTTHDISHLTRLCYSQYETVLYLLDGMALENRLGEYAAALPGIVIDVASSDKLEPALELVREIIAKNQTTMHRLAHPDNTYVFARAAQGYLHDHLRQYHSEGRPEREELLRSRQSNRRIMKQLINGLK